MKRFSPRLILLTASVLLPYAVRPVVLFAEEHHYHDSDHNDDHAWNNREDRAYRTWVKENHRKYVEFPKLREEDQRAYWNWRHQHSDDERRDHK